MKIDVHDLSGAARPAATRTLSEQRVLGWMTELEKAWGQSGATVGTKSDVAEEGAPSTRFVRPNTPPVLTPTYDPGQPAHPVAEMTALPQPLLPSSHAAQERSSPAMHRGPVFARLSPTEPANTRHPLDNRVAFPPSPLPRAAVPAHSASGAADGASATGHVPAPALPDTATAQARLQVTTSGDVAQVTLRDTRLDAAETERVTQALGVQLLELGLARVRLYVNGHLSEHTRRDGPASSRHTVSSPPPEPTSDPLSPPPLER